MKRYLVFIHTYIKDSPMKFYRNGEIHKVEIEDTFENQTVAIFPVKVSTKAGGNPDYYGVTINSSTLALKMARSLCEQMNRESGYEFETA